MSMDEFEADYEKAIEEEELWQEGRLAGLLEALAAIDKGGRAEAQLRALIAGEQ